MNWGQARLSSGSDTATITVNAVAETPQVTGANTGEDTKSSSGLVITRGAADGGEVTHFEITDILEGTLFQANGSSQIDNGDFISVSQGNSGLKFMPSNNTNTTGTFDIKGATDDSGSGISLVAASASITINPLADTRA
jgi:hypothetical protein